MMKKSRILRYMPIVACALVLCAVTGCKIDEDLSDCGRNYTVRYTVHQNDNLQQELSDELTTPAELVVRSRLEPIMKKLFVDEAYDLDAPFYAGDQCMRRETHIMNAHTMTLVYPMEELAYSHLPMGNTSLETTVAVLDPSQGSKLAMRTAQTDTIPSQGVALFTARCDIPVLGIDQTVDADLYMVNSASALVLDTQRYTRSTPTDISCYATGFETTFAVSDSIYSNERNQIVCTNRIDAEDVQHICYYTITMPSATDQWQYRVYVAHNGKIVESTLTVNKTLPAGQIRIIKAILMSDGTVRSSTAGVGVTVELDWKPNGDYEIEI